MNGDTNDTNESWLDSITSEYTAQMAQAHLAQLQKQARTASHQRFTLRTRKLGLWGAAGVLAMLLLGGHGQWEAMQKREKDAAQADVIWAMHVLEKTTFEGLEVDYLPEDLQAIAHLTTVLEIGNTQ